MANKFRYVSGDIMPVPFEVASATEIAKGDLVYVDSSTKQIKPASDLTYASTLALTQESFHDKFAGVAMDQSRDGDTTDVMVATAGVWEFDCASATFDNGDLVGVDDNAGGTALEDQQVIAVATENLAIGRVYDRYSSATTSVKVEIVSTVQRGGPQAKA